MSQLKAKDIMTKEVVTIDEDMSVKEVANLFSDKNIGGAPVVDDKGKLVGIVTESDLIMQDVKIHFPTYIQFLDGFIFLESMKKFEDTLRKAVGAKVKDVMTRDVVTAEEETTLEDIATLMAEKDLGRIPVLKEGEVIGMVAKRDIVKAIGRS